MVEYNVTVLSVSDNLSSRIGKVAASHAEVARSIPGWAEAAQMYSIVYTMHESIVQTIAQGVLPIRLGVRPVSWIYHPDAIVRIAGCGRLQLGVPHWATSVN